MKRTLLPLNALRVLDAAARHLSFTRAADELAVTPAAVGQQVRALEDLLGTILFRRTTRGLELTPEAEAALPALRDGFAHFEDAVQTLQAAQASAVLTIACHRAGVAWLLPKLAAARPEGTHIRLSLIDGTPDFAQSNLDLALSWGPPPDAEGVHGRQLADETLVPAAAPGAPAGWLHWPGGPEPLGPVVLSVDHPGLAVDAALAGLAAAWLPATLAAPYLASGALVPQAAPMPTPLAFWLAAPAPQWRSAKVRAFVAALLADTA
jgi:LysR family glycine cleavage system transcriptional activator